MKSVCDFLGKTIAYLVAASISVCMGGAAWANGVAGSANLDYFELSAEQLFSAEVTSVTKTPQSVLKSPAAIYVISSEDIIRSGATSIPEVLRMAPGVHVARINNHSWAIGIRGMNDRLSNKLLILMDGRTLYNSLFSGTYWDVQDYVLEDIDRIEVIRGPGAALWGANAVNGVINIVTKKAENTQGNMLKVGIGNEERLFTTARHGGELENGNGFYRVYGKYFNRDAQRANDGGEASDDWQAFRSGFRVDLQQLPNTNDTLTVQGGVYRSDADQLTDPFDISNPGLLVEDTIRSEGLNLLTNWKRQLSGDSALTVLSYVDYTSRDEVLLDDRRLSFEAETMYEMEQMGRHKLNSGLRYRYTTDSLQGNPAVSFDPSDRTDHLFSAFIQDQITLKPEEWYLTLGAKFEHNDYSGFEIQPNVRLQWHPDNRQTLWASVSRAVRTPSRLEHDVDLTTSIFNFAGTPSRLVLQGNRDFDSEELIAYEAGYRHLIGPDISLDTAIFYNVYDKLKITDVTSFLFVPADAFGPDRFLLTANAANDMTGETYGFETTMDWRVTDNWRLAASYSFLDLQLHSAGTVFNNRAFSSEDEEGEAPHHMFNIYSLYNITDNVTYDAFLYYVDSLQEHEADDYVRLDMRLGWRINDSLHFNLVGQNLLDDAHREFSESVASTQIQRSIFAKVIWQF